MRFHPPAEPGATLSERNISRGSLSFDNGSSVLPGSFEPAKYSGFLVVLAHKCPSSLLQGTWIANNGFAATRPGGLLFCCVPVSPSLPLLF